MVFRSSRCCTGISRHTQCNRLHKKMRKRNKLLSQGWGQLVTPLLVDTAGGKQKLNCANAQGLLRIIQSIPSPKAEPFKLWLAQVGSDRLDEIENPELATQRTRELFSFAPRSSSKAVVG
ncbi:BRO family protein [Agriterribacter sp.]|uniref:BRO family protein n=1 Tax=Agriterribacter sp. TaxID=2821509 RepID=UPI002D1F9E0D|nr:BRO family protein [Agriterribacter sp.]